MKSHKAVLFSAWIAAAVFLMAFAAPFQTSIRTAAALTNAYVASATVTNLDQIVTVEVYLSGTGEPHTCSLKPQWSVDGTNFIDEPVNTASAVSGTEQPYTRTSKRFDFSCANTNLVFTEAFEKWGACSYFRVAVKDSSGAGTTNSLVAILASTSKAKVITGGN